jgi:hypothetical protein
MFHSDPSNGANHSKQISCNSERLIPLSACSFWLEGLQAAVRFANLLQCQFLAHKMVGLQVQVKQAEAAMGNMFIGLSWSSRLLQ